MIINLKQFIGEERPLWKELEQILKALEKDPDQRLEIAQVKRFHYLYQRASADLARIMTFSSERQIRRYLETLVARAYGEIHESRERKRRTSLKEAVFHTFPQTFRRHISAFWLATLVMLLGSLFGAFAVTFDPAAKAIILPFPHLLLDPSERVAQEEQASRDRLKDCKTHFSSFLMTHNTRVSIFTLALGMTWGIGTVLLLFYNGVILGAVALDYIFAGEGLFLAGWLLPHGVIEIPAILLAGQAGLVLASALIGWGEPVSVTMRLRQISSDLTTLIFGIAVMLVWAGVIEAFFSQYHEPIMPYAAKVGFGIVEFGLLILFLTKSGKKDGPHRREVIPA